MGHLLFSNALYKATNMLVVAIVCAHDGVTRQPQVVSSFSLAHAVGPACILDTFMHTACRRAWQHTQLGQHCDGAISWPAGEQKRLSTVTETMLRVRWFDLPVMGALNTQTANNRNISGCAKTYFMQYTASAIVLKLSHAAAHI